MAKSNPIFLAFPDFTLPRCTPGTIPLVYWFFLRCAASDFKIEGLISIVTNGVRYLLCNCNARGLLCKSK